jgi:hypothetical protein
LLFDEKKMREREREVLYLKQTPDPSNDVSDKSHMMKSLLPLPKFI